MNRSLTQHAENRLFIHILIIAILIYPIERGRMAYADIPELRGQKLVFAFTTIGFLGWRAKMSIPLSAKEPKFIHVLSESRGVNGIRSETDYKVLVDHETLLPQKMLYEETKGGSTTAKAQRLFLGQSSEFLLRPARRQPSSYRQQHGIELRDPVSAFLALRAWVAAHPRDSEEQIEVVTSNFDVSRGSDYYRCTARIVGHDKQFFTQLGVFSAIRIEGEMIQVNADGSPIPGVLANHGTIWLSEDSELRPLRLKGHLGWDDATLELVQYDPSTVPMPMPSSLPGAICRSRSAIHPCLRSPH